MSNESTGEHETPMPHEGEHEDPMAPHGTGEAEIIDLATPDAPPEPTAPELAEPGVYVCIHEQAGEHAVLGVLEFGQEYDYSATQDERTLAAVAACVEGGYLEKVG